VLSSFCCYCVVLLFVLFCYYGVVLCIDCVYCNPIAVDKYIYIPSDSTMNLESTQPLVKMNTRNISWG